MNNETDLDWLARNVHEWYRNATHVRSGWRGPMWTYLPGWEHSEGWFTRDQWLTRRAELQNKPSWKDAPEWVNWIMQSSTGLWFGSDREPEIDVVAGHSFIKPSSFRLGATFCDGEVLGDWRDTLERRPDRTRAEMEVELVKTALEPFTSIEDNQEQKMQQDNGWFERGELPSVNIAVQLWHGGTYAYDYEIIAKRGNDFALWNLTWERPEVADCMMCEFRPIRTERELAVEEMKQHCPHHGSWDTVGRIYAEALYDAGCRKEAK